MILKEILESVQTEDVKNALERLYFNKKNEINKQSYVDLFESLKGISVVSSNTSMTIHVEFSEDFGNSSAIWNASYSLYRRYKQKYSLEFASIEDMVSANVIEEEVINKEEYIAHILWEKLYNNDSDEDTWKIQAQEKERRQKNKTEYCSVEEILESIDEEMMEED